MIVLNQSRNGKVVIRATSNESYVVAGNSSVSNLFSSADSTVIEPNVPYTQNTITINGAHLTKLIWTTNGQWTITRGANVVWNLLSCGVIDLRALGVASNGINDYPAANLVINCTSAGTLLIELAKDVSFVSEY